MSRTSHTFFLRFREYPSGGVVVEESHTRLVFEGGSKEEVRDLMVEALREWIGEPPDPEAPRQSLETVVVARDRRSCVPPF